MVRAHTGKTHTLSEVSKRKIGDANKKAYSDPVLRKATSDRVTKYYQDHPEELERLKNIGRASCLKINASRSHQKAEGERLLKQEKGE